MTNHKSRYFFFYKSVVQPIFFHSMLNSLEKSLEDYETSFIRPDNLSISNHYQPDASIDTSGDHASLNSHNRLDYLPQNLLKTRKEHKNLAQTLLFYENPQKTEETIFSEEKDDDNPQKCEKLILRDFQLKGGIKKLQNSLELSLMTDLRILEELNDFRFINSKFSCFHENMQNTSKSRKTQISMEKDEKFLKDSQDSPNKYCEFILGDHIENRQISRNWEVSFSLNSKQLRSNDHFYLLEHSLNEFSEGSITEKRSYEKNTQYLIF